MNRADTVRALAACEARRILRWQNPPPSRQGANRRQQACPWDDVARELTAKPGEWAVVAEGNEWQGAYTGLAHRIRTGSIDAFKPVGDFDACTRKIGDFQVVFARYVGGDL